MSTPPSQRVAAIARKPWLRRTLYGVAAFLLLFGLFGYFALPGIIKSQAEKLAAEKLNRQLSIEEISFHPFALTLDIRGLKLLEPDAKSTFVAFDLLQVNLSTQSLLHFAPVIQEVRLQKPYLHLARTASNRYNIDDLIALAANQPPSPDSGPSHFAAYNLQIEDGRIEFDDQPEATKHAISELKVGIPFVSSMPSRVKVFVEPFLSAKINDAPLLLKGNALPFAEPKEATIALNLADVDLTKYLEYVPFEPRFKVPSAALDVHLTTVFRQAKDKAPEIVLKGTTALKSLAVTEIDGAPMIKLQKLEVTLNELKPLSSQLSVSRILIDHPEIDVIKQADGSLNLARLAPPAPQQKAAPAAEASDKTKTAQQPSRNQRIALDELALHGAVLRYRDDFSAPPTQAGVEQFDLSIRQTEADLQKQTVTIGAVTSPSATFSVLQGKPTTNPKNAAQQPDTEEKPKSDASDSPGYIFTIASIGIDGWTARIEDRGQTQPAITTVNAIKLDAKNIANAAGSTGHIDLSAGVNKQGQVAIGGDVGIAPLHADLALDLKAVDLMPLQPYLTDKVNLLITRAALTTKASLKVDAAAEGKDKGKLKGSFKGDVAINDLATIDKLSSDDFLRWKTFAINGANVQLDPLSVSIDQIALNNFFARIILDAEGKLNLQNIMRGDGDEAKSLTEAEPAASSAATVATSATATESTSPTQATAAKQVPAAKSSALPPIKIRQVKLQNGQVKFSDNFIKPNYSAELMELGGTVSGLSSDSASRANVLLQGKVNSAPLNIAGNVNPLSNDLSLDIKADVRGMELAPFSPYSGKYIGYGIEKGKLSFEVAYKLENRTLEAQNRVILDQLTLGDKIESPTATTLPVRFALTLLSDRNGVIDINLPIGGSLDDPQFSIGGIIVKVIVNLITKAVTAPFALLGAMMGGGEELSWLEFDAGRYAIPQASEAKLESLAKALNDRPALKLEITGHFDANADRDGLRRASIDNKVRALKLKQMAGKGESADLASVAVSAEEYPALLTKVYKKEDFDKPRNAIGLQKDLPVEEMEKLMMANAKIGDAELVALGNQRAQAVKDWLASKGAVAAERIFVIAAKGDDAKASDGTSSKAKASRADFSLR